MNMSLRQERMRLLALAPETSLDEALSGISLPGYRIVRGPETGLVMARGRVGNVGDVFNVGEVLVTRCVVQLEEKTLGHAWIMGESPAMRNWRPCAMPCGSRKATRRCWTKSCAPAWNRP